MVIALALAVELSVRGKTPVYRELIPRSALLVQHLQRNSGLISRRTLQRGTYRHKSGSQGDSFEEPALTSEDFSQVDDTLLDLEPEDSSTNAPLTGISPLTSLPAPLPAQNILATSCTLGLVHQPFSGCRTLCHSQSLRIFLFQDTLHTRHLADKQLWIKSLFYLFHSHRGLSLQQRYPRLLEHNSLGVNWNSRTLK